MSKIKNKKQFFENVDTAFETMKTRDEAKACYDFEREEFKIAEEEICAFAAAHPGEVFAGQDAVSGWGETDNVCFTVSSGRSVERADGGKMTDEDFLDTIPKRYIRVKRELNKAKLKSDGLDADALKKLGLMVVETRSLKLKAKSAA